MEKGAEIPLKGGPELFENPVAYCDRYYSFKEGSDVSSHQVLQQRLAIFDELYKRANLANARIIEFGGGPTIWSLISAVRYAETITFTDFGQQNVDFLKTWKAGGSESYDFSSLIRYAVADVEGDRSESAASERQDALRSKMAAILKADVTAADPVDASLVGHFDVVSVHYCLLHAVKTHDDYAPCLANLEKYLKPNGLLMLSEMLGCFHAQRQYEKEKKEGDEKKEEEHHGRDHHGDEHHGHHHHHHGHDHVERSKQFIFDSVKAAGFEVIEHRLIAREAPVMDVPGARDASSWTTVAIMARKI